MDAHTHTAAHTHTHAHTRAPAHQSVTVDYSSPLVFDTDRRHTFSLPDARRNLLLAYALTVHKAQGCEYPVVCLPVSSIHSHMMTRRLLYTALTRARVAAVMFGDKHALKGAVGRVHTDTRLTGLARALCADVGKGRE